MDRIKIDKVVSVLPNPLIPNTVYAVRVGNGFDLFFSDSTGSIAHELNSNGIDQTTNFYNSIKPEQLFNPTTDNVLNGSGVYNLLGSEIVIIVSINGKLLTSSEYSLTGNQLTVTPTNGFDSETDQISVYQSGFEASGEQSSSIEDTFETISKNLSSHPSVINYAGGDITSIVYNLGAGQSINKTLNYTNGDITNVVLSGNTPQGISLTKTLTYTDVNITSITYS